MKTRCKFKIDSVTSYGGNYETIKASAIYGDVGENKSPAAATPSGSLEFTVTNPEVVGNIKPGTSYYLDLIPVDA